MTSIIKKILASRIDQRHEERQAELYRSLIRREARLGGELFGPVPDGVRREFFCLDKRTWIWHEEWTNEAGQRQVRTTRYDIRPNGILKAQDGQSYHRLSRREAEHLRDAALLYYQRIRNELYANYL